LARLIRSYLKDLSFEAFQTDTVRQDAVARRFEIIGEASDANIDHPTSNSEWGRKLQGEFNRVLANVATACFHLRDPRLGGMILV
jgi:hypothetical protein